MSKEKELCDKRLDTCRVYLDNLSRDDLSFNKIFLFEPVWLSREYEFWQVVVNVSGEDRECDAEFLVSFDLDGNVKQIDYVRPFSELFRLVHIIKD